MENDNQDREWSLGRVFLWSFVCLVAFALGVFVTVTVGNWHTKELITRGKAIQAALDAWQRTYPQTMTAATSDSARRDQAITAALLGRNPALNPSNFLFIAVPNDSIVDGLITAPRGGFYYGFRLTSWMDKNGQMTNRWEVVNEAR